MLLSIRSVPVNPNQEKHMFTLNGLVEFAHRYRVHRKRQEMNRVLSGLSEDIRKDIGWPAADMPTGREAGVTGPARHLN